MPKTIHEYEKGGVTVVWRPALCIHSGECVRGLGAVFNPNVRPWINMDAAPVTRIAEQVKRCPSGALSLAGPKTDDRSSVQGPFLVMDVDSTTLRIDPQTTEDRSQVPEWKHAEGSDFLMDGGVTAVYWFGELAPT